MLVPESLAYATIAGVRCSARPAPVLSVASPGRAGVLYRSGHCATAIGYKQIMSVVEREVASPHPAYPKGMVWVPGGSFRMGSIDFYPEERPVHDVSVDGFWMDE